MTKIVLDTYYENDKIVKSASLYTGGGIKNFCFKFPKSVASDLTDRADPFVHALIFPMMEQGGNYEIEGAVSKSVLANMTMFCRIWHIWCPDKYKPITITAQEIADDYRPDNKSIITAFSGGLDASYTLYKYKKNLDKAFQYNVNRAIMLLGADIPLSEREQFDMAFNNAQKMTDDLGVELIPVETNYREHTHNWSYEFGSVILASLEFFSKKYFYGAAASDDHLLFFSTPWGTNPITDKYLTSDTFRFIVDGLEHSRTERAAFIKDWQVGLENLRVCWCNENKSKNCGKCEKCVRTKLNFMAVGVNHLPSMPNDLTLEELLNNDMIKIPHNILYYQEIYDYAKQHNTLAKEWLSLLEKQLIVWKQKFSLSKKDKIRYWRYKLFSRITFGKTRERYERKKNKLKKQLEELHH